MAFDLAIYFAFRLSGLLMVLALLAVLFLPGGWEATAAAFTIAEGMVFVLCFIVLVTAEDGTSAQTRA